MPLTECKNTSFIIIKTVLKFGQQITNGYKMCKNHNINRIDISEIRNLVLIYCKFSVSLNSSH